MTYREAYFKLQKIDNKYLNLSVIKSLLEFDGGFSDFFNLAKHFDDEIKDEDRLNKQIEKVLSGEPIQYVLGQAYFVNSFYYVNKDVLIPRQETEELAVSTLKMIVKMFGKDPNIKIVDIGGNTRHVVKTPGLYNLMAREFTYAQSEKSQASIIHNSSSAVIHLIDGPLMVTDTNNQ